MRKTLLATAVAGVLSLPSLVMAADASPHSFSGNVGISTEYIFRGIAQTAGKPALQGGFDYSHASGFYAGVWGSNISWLSDLGQSSSLELDVYGGFKGAVTDDFGYDVGILTYNYPGHYAAGFTKADTTELYGALSWKFVTLKYSQSTTNLFGNSNSKNSGYLEVNAAYDFGDGLGFSAHVGKQKIKGVAGSVGDYTDYKLGLTKDLGVGVLGLAISATNAKDDCGAGEFYCFTPSSGSPFSAGRSRAVLTFSKSF